MTSRLSVVAALVLCAGSALSQTTWTNPLGGNWNLASNWDTATVPNSTVVNVLLPNITDPYIVSHNLSGSVLSCFIDTDVTLGINPGFTFSFASGGLLNNGLIIINSAGSSTNVTMRSIDAATISGSGRIELNSLSPDLFDALLTGNIAPMTIASGQTIAGSGVVQGPITLQGIIDADRANRDIQLTGVITATGGTIRGSNDGTIALRGTIIGGSLEGNVEADSTSGSLDGTTSSGTNGVRPGATFNLLEGGLINNGTWIVNTIGSTNNATFRSIVPATIDGFGTIELNSISVDLFDAQVAGIAGAPLTIASPQSITGSGVVQGPMTLLGSINANRTARDILLRGDITGVGFGNIRGTNGGSIAFEATMAGGNIAGGVEAQSTTGQINGVESTGTNGVRPGSTLNLLEGGLVNNGTWIINTDGTFNNAVLRSIVPAAITGSGIIELNAVTADLFDAQLGGINLAPLTIGPDQLIVGSGVLQGPVVLQGTVQADRDARDIELRGTFDATGGIIRGINGGKAVLSGATITGGTFAGGVEVRVAGNTIESVTSTGTNGVRPGAQLIIGSAGLVNNGTFIINTDGTFSDASIIASTAPAAITGNGTIELNAVTADLGDSEIRGSVGVPLTIGADQTVTGSGRVRGPIILDGTINANRDARDLQIIGGTGGPIDASNGGRLQGTDNGTVTLSAATFIGGTWLGNVHVDAGFSTISDVTLEGTNGIRPTGTFSINSPSITNNGTLIVNTLGTFSDSVISSTVDTTIDGTGTILFNAATADFGDARITPSASTITLSQGQTIAGRGRINGPTRILGTIAPGSDTDPTQDIEILIAPQLESTTRFEFDIAGTAIGQYDRILGNAAWVLDGTIDIQLLDGFIPTPGDRFTLFTGSGITGQPHTVNSPTSGFGSFRIVFSSTKVEAVWTCVADLNGDSVLDFFDLLTFLDSFTNQGLYSDYNEDGVSDFFDILAFLADLSGNCL